MDAFTLLLTLVLTFALAVVSARQLLGGVLYLMVRNSAAQSGQPSTGIATSAAS